MRISEEGVALIKKFEGCELESYKCPAGVWTIGYGHTKGVKEGDSISMNEADEMLEKELIEYENYVDTLVTVPLTDYQRDALISWTYNLGPTNLKSSTLLRKLNEGDYDAVPHEMMRWTRAGGKELEGLVKRRTVEANMFQREYVYSILR